MSKVPHVIPYQGSKRKLAQEILSFVHFDEVNTFFEPFACSAAVTLAAASQHLGRKYVIGDKYKPLTELWKMIISQPELLLEEYSSLWTSQLEDPKDFFSETRSSFNQDGSPVKLLYLIARCVKNAIRFNAEGEFNQSPDHRRLGMNPKRLKGDLLSTSKLLKGKTQVMAGDFMEILQSATPDDLVYMDPPWQGTSGKKDSRYACILDLDSLVRGLQELNVRKIPFLLSFDGSCGGRKYGKELPQSLRLQRVELRAGRSSQATLLGRDEDTIESLYLSPALMEKNITSKRQSNEWDQICLSI